MSVSCLVLNSSRAGLSFSFSVLVWPVPSRAVTQSFVRLLCLDQTPVVERRRRAGQLGPEFLKRDLEVPIFLFELVCRLGD